MYPDASAQKQRFPCAGYVPDNAETGVMSVMGVVCFL